MKLERLPDEFIKAKPVLKKLIAAGFEAYFVGGSVRDVLMARAIHDVDIATSAYPQEVKEVFPYTIDVGIAHGTVLVLAGKSETEHYEITTFRTESQYTDYRRPDQVTFVRNLSEDLKRRDFTINALAMGVDGEIIDLFDGLTDLNEKLLRAVGDAHERFREDALRIMRAHRFAAEMNLAIEPATFAAMKQEAQLLRKISVERIFAEMDKLLLADFWGCGLDLLSKSGAWQFLPDFDQPDKLLLALIPPDFHFQNSAQAWAFVTIKFGGLDLRRWKVSNELIKAVSQLTEAYQLHSWDLTSIYKYGLANARLVDELKAAEGKNVDFDRAIALDRQLQIHDKSEIALKGADLLAMGYQAGPEIGEILRTLEEKIVNNRLENRADALLEEVRKMK